MSFLFRRKSMPCDNDSSGITIFTTMMLFINQIISWIGFHLTIYASIACGRVEVLYICIALKFSIKKIRDEIFSMLGFYFCW